MPRLFLATAGWGIPRDLAAAFPTDGSALARYARVFGATEINSTFWRRHRPSTFERWRASVPRGFRFAVKLPRTLTHEAELAAPRAGLREFFDDVRGLGDKLGPVLVQLPASVPFDARRVGAFFGALRSMHDGPVACEPRHPSWYVDAASALLVRHDVARVAADPPRPEQAAVAGGARSLVYHRLHGSPRRYHSSYEQPWLTALAGRLREAPAKATVWCVFDNTASGAAAGDALRLSELLRRRAPVAEERRRKRPR